jgi:hypothetical protein
MADKIDCAIHGECSRTYVCSHLTGETAGLGFNRSEPTDDNPFPDAWCDDCELVRAGHGGWNESSERLVARLVLCSFCYERSRIRNTRTSVTLAHLAGLRWKCGSCEEWHTGPCLDFSYASPCYWLDKHDKASRLLKLVPMLNRKYKKTFLDDDHCAIEDRDFFIRGIIHLPIIGAGETFRWGVWGSLSRDNFEMVLKRHEDPSRTELPRMFSWLSNQIPEYTDTLNLEMYVHIQKPGSRPHFLLEPEEHPLSQEYYKGITAERVEGIMRARLKQIGPTG